jgi:DNA-binding MarR family transcriptional regulator
LFDSVLFDIEQLFAADEMGNVQTPDSEARFREMLERSFGDVDMSAMELFRNLMKTYHLLNGLTERHIARYNLSTAKLRILYWLKIRADDGAEGGGLLPSELSRFQGVTPNTMSSLLNSLREAGLIEQINHPVDRRKRIITITPKGLELLSDVGPVHHKYIRTLLVDLSEEERQILSTLLRKLGQSLKAKMDCEYQAAEQAQEQS